MSRSHLRLLHLVPLVPLVLLATACTDEPADEESGTDAPAAPAIPENARMVWSTGIEDDWDATGAVAVGDWVVVAKSWDLEEDSAVIGVDAHTGEQWWERGPGYGPIELTVLDDGTVQACDSLGGAIRDPASGDELREATTEECPEDADRDLGVEDVYEVDGSELVVYDDLDHSEEQYRIVLRDDDAVAWGVDGGVVTYSESSHEVRFYA